MRITKKQRRLAYELLQACATWCTWKNEIVFVRSIGVVMLDDIDKIEREEVMFIASLAFRAAEVHHQHYVEEWTEKYAEAAAMLLEGWNPPDDD